MPRREDGPEAPRLNFGGRERMGQLDASPERAARAVTLRRRPRIPTPATVAYLGLPPPATTTFARAILMTGRANTLLTGRRERIERILERSLEAPTAASEPIPNHTMDHLGSEAQDLYWNELEWEHITDEEALEEGPITEMTFPGFLAYVRGLLLEEVMPDSLAPANPRPQAVKGVLDFLAARVVELGERVEEPGDGETDRLRAELDMTAGLIDRVLYLYHGLAEEDVERVEAAHA
jgi:hypothetical protein